MVTKFMGSITSALIFSITVQAQNTITLSQAIDSALANNLQIKKAQFEEAATEANLQLSKTALYPSVNGTIATYKLFGRVLDPTANEYTNTNVKLAQGNLYADVTLFQGFQKLNQIKQNKYFLEAGKDATQKAKNDLVLSVLSTYLQVLSNRDLLTAAKQQQAVAKQQLEQQKKFYNVKQKTAVDLSQAQSLLSGSELNVTNAQNELERSYLTLAQLMERSAGSAFVVVDPDKNEINILNTKYSAQDVYTAALQKFPDVLLAVNRRLGYEKGVAVAKGRLYPTLGFGGALNTSYSSNLRSVITTQVTGLAPIGVVSNTGAQVVAPVFQNNTVAFGEQLKQNFNQAVGFTLLLPIFNGFQSRIVLRKAKIQYQEALIDEQLTKVNLNKVIAEAVWDLQATYKKYKSSQTTFNSAVEAYKAIQQRYSVGLVNSLDVSIAQTNRNIAEFGLIQVKYDLIFKSKLIDYYLGNPISF